MTMSRFTEVRLPGDLGSGREGHAARQGVLQSRCQHGVHHGKGNHSGMSANELKLVQYLEVEIPRLK